MIKERIIRDPIHGFISLSHYSFIQELVDTSYFQRLRRLSQLGLSLYVYPSATHSRLNHSLGAMELFTKIFDHLFIGTNNTKGIQDLRKIGIVATLLHDIGHGPLSHACERIFNFKHETITNLIIRNTEIRDILSSNAIDVKDITKIIGGIGLPKHKIVSQLVSSQLDVDRLDFLQRDAYFTGVGFSSVDLQRIIKMMQIYNGEGDINGYAVVSSKGIPSIESYILSRHLMYQGVYYHKTTRCMEQLLSSTFERAKALDRKGKLELPNELDFLSQEKPTFQNILGLDDHVVYGTLLRWTKNSDSQLSDLSSRIINRCPLKGLDLGPEESIKPFVYRKELEETLQRSRFDPEYYLLIDDPAETPYSPYSPKGADDQQSTITNIFALDQIGKPREISQLSSVVQALSTKKSLTRLYFPHECSAEVLSILGRTS